MPSRRHLVLGISALALCADLQAWAGPVLAQQAATGPAPARVTVEHCVRTATEALGGDALHLEFESRGGAPTYELIIGTDRDTYYVGCDATTGFLGEVDVIVRAGDPRWAAVANTRARSRR